jgi:hypothetical protein
VFVAQENIVCTLKWPSLTAKIGKKYSFYKEKSLVGLTLGNHKNENKKPHFLPLIDLLLSFW